MAPSVPPFSSYCAARKALCMSKRSTPTTVTPTSPKMPRVRAFPLTYEEL